jgi:hypothetical protein
MDLYERGAVLGGETMTFMALKCGSSCPSKGNSRRLPGFLSHVAAGCIASPARKTKVENVGSRLAECARDKREEEFRKIQREPI